MRINTSSRREVVDITNQVKDAVSKSGILQGFCLVYTLHTTTALTVNEGEAGLIQDILDQLVKLIPEGKDYHHWGDDNAHAHIQAALLGHSVVLPVEDGLPVLGTWQRILFLELDGPRTRTVEVKTIEG